MGSAIKCVKGGLAIWDRAWVPGTPREGSAEACPLPLPLAYPRPRVPPGLPRWLPREADDAAALPAPEPTFISSKHKGNQLICPRSRCWTTNGFVDFKPIGSQMMAAKPGGES
ncbi:hypothetical protein JAAARDRAFT_42862 [Jaapia argillacea MUCL 33604]|uniref:Uncharacterized protein n=1 Tax=Jaapia argillacea MUCL 33604 TaxID=933084 RepID=A0A067PGD0_9AGAM|nr:hypothetical protein JAAARDRAFT_42862 [Jaapia argillacea MUCL 33604]